MTNADQWRLVPHQTIERMAELQAEVERLRDVAARALERELRADEDADRLAWALDELAEATDARWRGADDALAAHKARKAEET